MILEQGDPFERRHVAWIREHIPGYENVWAAFIGHDGHGTPCDMRGLSNEQETHRKLFYQAHYSFVAKLMQVELEAKRFDEDLGQVTDATLEDATQRLFGMMCAVGYVRDMFKQMDEALKAKGAIYDELQKFYDQRSHVIHGPRLPYSIEDGLIKIPRVGGENALDAEWTNRSTWDSIPTEQYEFVHTFVQDLAEELLRTVVLCHGKLFAAADRYFAGARIDPRCGGGTEQTIPSGTTQSHQ